MNQKHFNLKKTLRTGLAALILASCGGGDEGTDDRGIRPVPEPTITAQRFVHALNNIDHADGHHRDSAHSALILDIHETHRGSFSDQDNWFVIYDALDNLNKAVSLQYLRSIAFTDYAIAEGFRLHEEADILLGHVHGDPLGGDYEVVDYNDFTDYFDGRVSGWQYEDEVATKDVALLAGESEQRNFLQKASRVSYAYSVDIKTALSLVTLGNKMENMLERSNGHLTAEDQKALTGDFEHLAGVTLEEVVEAATDQEKKKAVVSKIADKIGTTAATFEERILPELFSINI